MSDLPQAPCGALQRARSFIILKRGGFIVERKGREDTKCTSRRAFLPLAKIEFTLVAEDAAPVGVADALPGRSVAIAVLATRVGFALVAEVAPPARSAPAS